ncbi:MAG: PIG-L family deacetylase [Rhodobacter sp.]|nr:PIG-L family deacetylase [Rhodobacter sp.]
MPTPAQSRIARQMTRPRIVQLWWAMQPLRTVVSFLNTGAHPDDETTAMLAALRLGQGIDIAYACATRGEGGQNDIGTETGGDLGALRTAEMERAADWLSMRLYWLSESPGDAIFDFGFSKSGTETLSKWGRARTLKRFVDIVRSERPDILCPTFLDVPGQHGHHRAMTETALRAFEAAADPDFADCDLPVWQVKKLYLPAWGGGGGSYDDEVPPPEATLVIAAKGTEPVSGWSFAQIAQQSRAFHRSQGMGRWIPPGAEGDWPLHLEMSRLKGPDEAITSGLPETVADLAGFVRAPALAAPLRAAQAAIERALLAFPDFDGVARHASAALQAVRDARAVCPLAAEGEVLHRLARKEAQLGRVIALALGAETAATAADEWLRPGERTGCGIEARRGSAEAVETSLDLPAAWSVEEDDIVLAPDAALHDPYRSAFDPYSPPAPRLATTITAHGVAGGTRSAFVVPPVAEPATTASIAPDRAVLNLHRTDRRIEVALSMVHPAGAVPAMELPPGWRAEARRAGIALTLPEDAAEGLYTLPLTLDGAPAQSVRRIVHPHIDPTLQSVPAALHLRVFDVALPQARVGYIGAGNDRVGHWLRAIGADVTDVADAAFGSAAALTRFDTLVVGIFAFRFRAGLAEAAPVLRNWVEAGGHLLTLYHRPWDNWDPDHVPPGRLEIGQPSLRWRVTDETAEVTHLIPDHPLLAGPNRIGQSDWDGWHKERGLYFAKRWDGAYRPLLSMADPGEDPHRGALVSAEIGQGRHTHCALILHHQMEKLVPGGFRLMANLIAPAH